MSLLCRFWMLILKNQVRLVKGKHNDKEYQVSCPLSQTGDHLNCMTVVIKTLSNIQARFSTGRIGTVHSDKDHTHRHSRHSFRRMIILDARDQQAESQGLRWLKFAMISDEAPLMSEDCIGELVRLVFELATIAHSMFPRESERSWLCTRCSHP